MLCSTWQRWPNEMTTAFVAELNAIGERYSETARALLDGDALVAVLDEWGQDADDIRDVLKAIALVKSAPQRSRDVVAGYGEIWSTRLLAAHLGQRSAQRGGTWIDARKVITVAETELGPTVLWQESHKFDRSCRRISRESRLLRDLSRRTRTDCRRHWGATAVTIRQRYSPRWQGERAQHLDGRRWSHECRSESRTGSSRHRKTDLQRSDGTGVFWRQGHPSTDTRTGRPERHSGCHSQQLQSQHPGSRIAAAPASQQTNIKGITAISGMALVNLEGSA